MNSHLLPFPYNQLKPPTWLDHILHPLSGLLFDGVKDRTPQIPVHVSVAGRGAKQELPPIRIICISDTHNLTPLLPPGDILIHAGDLTARGTSEEIQSQLRWISAQPHPHKIIVAGNHDIILDEASDAKFLSRSEDCAAERERIKWDGITYLQNESVTLNLPVPGLETQQIRKVTIFGSPYTPELGSWAFQYPAIRDMWTGRVPDDTDILVVHGPPALYGDCDGQTEPTGAAKVKGDGYLLREIRRVKPKMVVCGHIHGAFGTTIIRHDGIQEVENGLHMRWEGYGLSNTLIHSAKVKITGRRASDPGEDTLVVNAAIAPSDLQKETKSPVPVDLYLT
ncbi:hypothetical protein N7492_003211 [Penicillium capsulatum]|uniref:Calcineurin-like phosphoesterase domain-containing protein n=1 Tax=Penicillium capsulatum TaxID=69766 RepID=A0A9W9IQK7_9EURO|nr:hypothetical protein N7492_003211 [Penicillium capsulatum]KAJ6122202.1 hypothetical protein N7512_004667 [Penicillium capsulatum]